MVKEEYSEITKKEVLCKERWEKRTPKLKGRHNKKVEKCINNRVFGCTTKRKYELN